MTDIDREKVIEAVRRVRRRRPKEMTMSYSVTGKVIGISYARVIADSLLRVHLADESHHLLESDSGEVTLDGVLVEHWRTVLGFRGTVTLYPRPDMYGLSTKADFVSEPPQPPAGE